VNPRRAVASLVATLAILGLVFSASASAAGEECPNLGMPGAGFLPSCRAWEMVSPPEKMGYDVMGDTFTVNVSTDGDRVTFTAGSPFGDAKGASIGSEYLASRTLQPGSNGWESHGINPPAGALTFPALTLGAPFPHYEAFNPDLSAGVFLSWRSLTDAPNVAEIANYYRMTGLHTGELTPSLLTDSVLPAPSIPAPFKLLFLRPYLIGASTDLSHVVFETKAPLTSGDPDHPSPDGEYPFNFQRRLFENADGEVRLVGRVPQGSATECDDENGPACEVAGSSLNGLGFEGAEYPGRTVSADGSRVAFQTPSNGNIYLREGGAKTYQLNATENPGSESKPAEFWEASRDLSRIFFSTPEPLLAGDDDAEGDLYMYEVEKPAGDRLTLISTGAASGGEVQAVPGASDNGDYLYFVHSGVLTSDGQSVGSSNLYVWHDGDLSYIGHFWDASMARLNGLRTSTRLEGSQNYARVSPNGRFLLFGDFSDEGWEGRGGFAGFDHDGYREAYLYSADDGSLRCASCNPSGEFAGNGVVLSRRLTGRMPPSATDSHNLSDDGRFVFFGTAESLVPEDTNGVADAYQYDALADEVRLISSGTSPDGGHFLNASADGRDAYIMTRERLSGWDTDRSQDLYTARIGGGLPEPPPVPAACEGESCPAPAPPAPPPPALSSSSVAGGGNPKQPCRKGTRKVRKNGKVRCVKKKAKHRHKNTRGANTNRRAAK
jgi:hypothetical protein